MTTRQGLRISLRERLEDTGDAPRWSDGPLNEFLGQAMRVYGVQIPTQSTAATVSIAAAATSVALPAGVDADEVVSVRNVAGETVPRFDDKVVGAAPLDSRGIAQGWVARGTTLRFRRPIVGTQEIGIWSIDYIGGRELVSDDITAQPIVAGDEPIVEALAAAAAFDRRATEFGKRGDATGSKEMREVGGGGAALRRPRAASRHFSNRHSWSVLEM